VGISNNDDIICAGMKDGTVWVIDCDASTPELSWEKRIIFKQSKEWISDIKFSPDDTKCAIGAHD